MSPCPRGPTQARGRCMDELEQNRHIGDSLFFNDGQDFDPRQRDIFPLPLLTVDALGESEFASLGRKDQRRFSARGKIARMANEAITALNELYFGAGKCPPLEEVRGPSTLPTCQREAVMNIINSVKLAGAQPAEANTQGALEMLRVARSAYCDSQAGVGTVERMRLGDLSLPEANCNQVDLSAVLKGEAGESLRNFKDVMLQDASGWAQVCDDACKVKPYTDPLLRRREQYVSFLGKLYDAGVLSFTRRVRGRFGAFAVSKKPKLIGGKKIRKQRLVLDCRQVNLQFRAPPISS